MRKKSCLVAATAAVAAAMNNGIFALARIKIAPYGNLVGNCRDMMPWTRLQRGKETGWKEKKRGPKLQPKVNQVTLFLPTANCLSPMRQNCGKTKQKKNPYTAH